MRVRQQIDVFYSGPPNPMFAINAVVIDLGMVAFWISLRG